MIRFTGRAILLDIEGTTSSVSYVYDVLFPFVRQHLSAFLDAHGGDADVRRAWDRIAKDAGRESLSRPELEVEVSRLMDGDAKATGLKELQGLIWRQGYASGQLRSHVYPDVPAALARWTDRGIDLCIYSSGSVTAQRLFFGHTERGDLLPYLRGHYDTTIGGKRDSSSYTAIAADMGKAPGEILFLSDVTAELDAATAAGLRTGLVVRPGNAAAPAGHGHEVVTSFDEIAFV